MCNEIGLESLMVSSFTIMKLVDCISHINGEKEEEEKECKKMYINVYKDMEVPMRPKSET